MENYGRYAHEPSASGGWDIDDREDSDGEAREDYDDGGGHDGGSVISETELQDNGFDAYAPSYGGSHDGENSGYSSESCEEPRREVPRPNGNDVNNSGRIQQLEDFMRQLNEKLDYLKNTPMVPIPDAPPSAPEPPVTLPDAVPQSVRWDNIKPFPNNVPSNKMFEQWGRFIENFEITADLNNARDPVVRSKLLLISVGEELKDIIHAANLRPPLIGPNCYQEFTDNIRDYLKTLTDPATELEAFSRMEQKRSEKAITFLARLTEKAKLCGYSPENMDYHVRSQLLKGLTNKDIVKDARRYKKSTYEVVMAATNDEAYEPEETAPQVPEICAVDKNRGRGWNRDNDRKRKLSPERFGRPAPQKLDKSAPRKFDGPPPRRFRDDDREREGRRSKCSRCLGLSHSVRPCPALDKQCFICQEVGHYAAACRKKRLTQVNPNGNGSSVDQHINALSLQDVLVDCRLGGSNPIQFLVDSGADVNVICGKDWASLKQEFDAGLIRLNEVSQGGTKLHAYGSDLPMKVACTFEAEITGPRINQPIVCANFYVVVEGSRSLLGRSTASEMGLLLVNTTVNALDAKEFPKMPGVKVRFSIDKSVPPVKNAYFNVPAAFREAARQRLREMESQGIIEKVHTAPRWISGMSAVPKGKGDFRLVVNMKAPNRAINRVYYRLPLLEEMKVKLNGARYFTKLDLKNAFYHLELSKQSRELTTFLSEEGMYQFTRLLFGVNCAPEAFQQEMVRIMKTEPNTIVYIDDILVFAETLEDLRKTVSRVLQILRENNLTLNVDKCEFDRTRITFLGHELDADGFHVEEAKIKSIRGFREPASVSELRSFLGLASYISPHVKNFADITSPLWDVVSSKTWTWGPKQSSAFRTVKEQITNSCATLGFFSENDMTILYTDASPVALGAVLVQEDTRGSRRIISFASKSLSPTERRYPQNQREALGAVWAVENFSYYLLGRDFILRTDAKAVEFILNRSRESTKRALTRADGWALRLSPYRIKPEYVRGAENIADTPSRLHVGEDQPFNDESSPWEIARLEANAVALLSEEEIRTATSQDSTLQEVISALESGQWPNNLRQYRLIQDDLSTRNDLVIKTGCVVIPRALQERALEVAHAGHPSAAKQKSILRQRVWWPGMATDVERWVESCSTCAVNGKPERPTPMQRVFAPKAVWEMIAVDFNGPYAKFGGVYIFVIVDYRSRYLFAKPVKSTSFEKTREVLDDIFQREGFPKYIKSDNGPPFNSVEYKDYCTQRDIKPIFSIPLFPQQNGLAESQMKVVNKGMISASINGTSYAEELQRAVDAHNAAYHSVIKLPPEEVFSGRKIRRGLPLVDFEGVNVDEDALDERDRTAKLQGKIREDARRRARECRVKPGDTVIIERHARGKGDPRFAATKYTVIEEKNGSLTLNDKDGRVVKRHVSQTKKVSEWRKKSSARDGVDSEAHHAGSSAQGIDHSSVKRAGSSSRTRRNSRERRPPAYLKDYALLVQDTV